VKTLIARESVVLPVDLSPVPSMIPQYVVTPNASADVSVQSRINASLARTSNMKGFVTKSVEDMEE
jgi:hypothetical protein